MSDVKHTQHTRTWNSIKQKLQGPQSDIGPSSLRPLQYPTSVDPFLLGGNKLLWHTDRVQRWLRGERVRPIMIDIGATKICNIKCEFCYGIFQKSLLKNVATADVVIPPDKLIKLFYDAPRLDIKALTLTGDGEPTLNPGFDKAIATGKAGGLDIGVATNGVALNDKRIENMLKSVVWTRINLSAASRESYIKIHGADKFDRVILNVEKFVHYKKELNSAMTIGLQVVLSPNALNEMIPLTQLAVDLGVDYLVVKQLSDPIGDLPCSGYNVEEHHAKAKPVLQVCEKFATERTKVIVKWDLLSINNRRPYPYCIDLPLIFQISGNSKCYPCGFLFNREEFTYGDLKTQSIGEILDSEHYWSVIDKIMNMHTKDLCPTGCCRHDATNLWMTNYMKQPQHINFI